MSDTFQEIQQKQHRSRMWLYGLLMLCTAVPLFFTFEMPTQPSASVIDLYASLQEIPEGSTILLQSDWTNSTRGESGGQFEALMRILMRKKVKFAVYSVADPQAPQVARDAIGRINVERVKDNLEPYKKWVDWVEVGFFPNAEGTGNAMASNIRKAWAGKKDMNENGRFEDVFKSPVLQNINGVADVRMLLNITGSKTQEILIERLYGKVPLATMCTGVMGPETLIYYQSNQLEGVSVGLKGVYDIETCMQYGINAPGPGGAIKIVSQKYSGREIPPFTGMKNYDRGAAYYTSLHFALLLLIGAVIVGNVQMIRGRKKEDAKP